MRTLLTALLLTGSALAAPLSITPPTQEVQPGALVILTASETVNWTASAGSLGSTQGTRIVLEAPRTAGTITVTITDPKDATRRAFAVVTVAGPKTSMLRLPTFVAGIEFSAAIAQDGSVWVWGSNDSNVIPTLREKSAAVPVRLDGLPSMATISTQNRDLFGVDAKQNAWSWCGRSAGPEVVKSKVTSINPNGCGLSVRGGDLFIEDRAQPDVKSVVDYDAYITEYSGNVITVAAADDGRVFFNSGASCPTLKPLNMPEPIVKVSSSLWRDVIAISRDGNGFISLDGEPAKPLAGFTNRE